MKQKTVTNIINQIITKILTKLKMIILINLILIKKNNIFI